MLKCLEVYRQVLKKIKSENFSVKDLADFGLHTSAHVFTSKYAYFLRNSKESVDIVKL